MSSTGTPVVLGTIPQAKAFFLQPLMHSWPFVAVIFFSAAFLVADGVILIKYWGSLRSGMVLWLICLAYNVVIGGMLKIARAHARINEEFLVGKLEKSSAGSSLDVVLDVAANSVLNSAITDLILISPYLWFIVYFVRHKN